MCSPAIKCAEGIICAKPGQPCFRFRTTTIRRSAATDLMVAPSSPLPLRFYPPGHEESGWKPLRHPKTEHVHREVHRQKCQSLLNPNFAMIEALARVPPVQKIVSPYPRHLTKPSWRHRAARLYYKWGGSSRLAKIFSAAKCKSFAKSGVLTNGLIPTDG